MLHIPCASVPRAARFRLYLVLAVGRFPPYYTHPLLRVRPLLSPEAPCELFDVRWCCGFSPEVGDCVRIRLDLSDIAWEIRRALNADKKGR